MRRRNYQPELYEYKYLEVVERKKERKIVI